MTINGVVKSNTMANIWMKKNWSFFKEKTTQKDWNYKIQILNLFFKVWLKDNNNSWLKY